MLQRHPTSSGLVDRPARLVMRRLRCDSEEEVNPEWSVGFWLQISLRYATPDECVVSHS